MNLILGIDQLPLYHRLALSIVPLVAALALASASDMAFLVVALAFASVALARTSDDALVGDNLNNVVPVASCAFAVGGNSNNVVPVALLAFAA